MACRTVRSSTGAVRREARAETRMYEEQAIQEENKNNIDPLSILENQENLNIELMEPESEHDETFQFDGLFVEESSVIDAYGSVVQPLVADVLRGYDSTILVDNQTKIRRKIVKQSELPNNLVHFCDLQTEFVKRALDQILNETTSRKDPELTTVKVSYLYVQHDELFDLLETKATHESAKLELIGYPTAKESMVVKGLGQKVVRNTSDVSSILNYGVLRRQLIVQNTSLRDSATCSIFTITVILQDTNDVDADVTITKLNFVDLFRGKNVEAAGWDDGNQMPLGLLMRLIPASIDLVPEGNPMLNRLLQHSLGERIKTSTIATVSPIYVQVPRQTFVFRASMIENDPEMNQKLQKKVLLGHIEEELDQFHRKVDVCIKTILTGRMYNNRYAIRQWDILSAKNRIILAKIIDRIRTLPSSVGDTKRSCEGATTMPGNRSHSNQTNRTLRKLKKACLRKKMSLQGHPLEQIKPENVQSLLGKLPKIMEKRREGKEHCVASMTEYRELCNSVPDFQSMRADEASNAFIEYMSEAARVYTSFEQASEYLNELNELRDNIAQIYRWVKQHLLSEHRDSIKRASVIGELAYSILKCPDNASESAPSGEMNEQQLSSEGKDKYADGSLWIELVDKCLSIDREEMRDICESLKKHPEPTEAKTQQKKERTLKRSLVGFERPNVDKALKVFESAVTDTDKELANFQEAFANFFEKIQKVS